MSKLSSSVFIVLVSLIVVSNGLVDEAKAPTVSPSIAPSPLSNQCSSILYENMVECLLFLIDDSTESKPDTSCCAGFESVVKINSDCICEALKHSFYMDMPINVTKALALPSACGLSWLPNCGVNNAISGPALAPGPGLDGPSPGLAPEEPPSAATSPSSNSSPSPSSNPSISPSSITLNEGPAPSQKGGAYSISASMVLLLVSLMVVYFF